MAHDPVYGGLRRPGRTEAIAAGTTAGPIILLLILIALLEWTWLRGPIGHRASARHDREIQRNGDLDVTLLPGRGCQLRRPDPIGAID